MGMDTGNIKLPKEVEFGRKPQTIEIFIYKFRC